MNRWISWSCNVYSFLLRAYPQEYRSAFADDMMQVFRDESITRYNQKGIFGLLFHWLKIFPDFLYTVIVEHVSSPTATWGLLEPVPNRPLPWKGLFLVLLPGFVYLAAQISQFTGRYLYLSIYNKAALFIIIPVIVVWIITKRFPIWGLIPLGLLYQFMVRIGSSLLIYLTEFHTMIPKYPFFDHALSIISTIWRNPVILVSMMALAIIFLLRRYRKQYPDSKQFYYWLGAIAVLAIVYILYEYVTLLRSMSYEVNIQTIWYEIETNYEFIFWVLREFLTVILLVCIATLFMKQHGFFSIFVFVGYILPDTIIGYPHHIETLQSIPYAMLYISLGVILYRVSLTLIAPVWMGRMKSQTLRKRVIIIPVSAAIAIKYLMTLYQPIFLPETGGLSVQTIVFPLLVHGITLLGFLLAISLYGVSEFESMDKSERKRRLTEIYVYS